jgi:hypothetical protein
LWSDLERTEARSRPQWRKSMDLSECFTKASAAKSLGRFIAFFLLLMMGTVWQVWAATITVGGGCTLVDAIEAANTDVGVGGCTAGDDADTIELTEDVTLTTINNDTFGNNGLPVITSNIDIDGNHHAIQRDPALFADGSPDDPCSGSGEKFRLFLVDASSTFGNLFLREITLRNGCAAGPDFNSQSGGAILVNVDAAIGFIQVSVLNNAALANGGGAFTVGSFAMSNSTIAYNRAGNAGGGILVGGPVTNIDNSTISHNAAATAGGGMMVDGGVLSLSYVTVAENTAGTAGGGIADFNAGTITVRNSILINATGGNCSITNSTIGAAPPDLDSDGTCPFAGLKNLDPQLGPLQDNGGPTLTHALLFGSPAIDAVALPDCTTTLDQRLVIRPVDGDGDGNADCDLGSYEFAVSFTFSVSTPVDIIDADDGQTSLREAIIDANSAPGSEPVLITFDAGLSGQTIDITGSPLPALTRGNIIVNGDLNGDNTPDVTLDGVALTSPASGVEVLSSGNTVNGLTVRNFPDIGILVLHLPASGPPIANNVVSHNIVEKGIAGIQVSGGGGIAEPPGSISNTTITDNHVSLASNNGIAVITDSPNSSITETLIANNTATNNTHGGIFIGASAPGSTIDGAFIFNNTATNNKRFGIHVLANETDPGSTIADTTIRDNEIAGNERFGILAESFGGRGNFITSLVIDKNEVHDNVNHDDPPKSSAGIVLNAGVCGGREHVMEATISENMLDRNGNPGSATTGIFVSGGGNSGCAAGAPAATLNRLTVTIDRNTLRDEKGSSLTVLGGQSDATDNTVIGVVTNNTILRSGFNGVSVLGGFGDLTTNNTVTAAVADNEVEESAKIGLEINGGAVGANDNTVNATVERNTLIGSENRFGVGGILLQGGASNAASNEVTVQFTSNTVTDNQGVGVDILGGSTNANANVVDATLEQNTITGNSVPSGTAGIVALGGFASSANNQATVRVRNNNMIKNNVGHGLSAIAGQDDSANNTVTWTVHGNTIEGNQGIGVVVLGGLGAFGLETGDSSNNTLDASITSNVIRRHPATGVSIQGGLASVNGRSGTVANANQVTVTVTDNIVDASGALGMFLTGGSVGDASDNTVDGQITNNTICDNEVGDIRVDGGFLGNHQFPPTVGTGNQVTGSITDNIVTFIAVADGVAGNTATLSQTPNTDCPADYDGDGVDNVVDLCPGTPTSAAVDENGCTPAQLDADGDGVPVGIDNCPSLANADQHDADIDGRGDACDDDGDNDGIPDGADNCDQGWNPGGLANDFDGDGKNDDCDNCPTVVNLNQTDTDGNGIGDVCESDSDLDQEKKIKKTKQKPVDPAITDSDSDGLTDAQEAGLGTLPDNPDTDGDTISDGADNCPLQADADQTDTDKDGKGDPCDTDDDGDGVNDPPPTGGSGDNCQFIVNPDQKNIDGDDRGDACDSDADDDTFDSVAAGGADCNDLQASVHPGGVEMFGNDEDDDCNPATPDRQMDIVFRVQEDLANPANVAASWLPEDGRMAVIIAEAVGIAGIVGGPPTVTLTKVGASRRPGTYTNDESLDESEDYEIVSATENQMVVRARDYGGKLVVHAQATFTLLDGTLVVLEKFLTLPQDTDNDDLPDAWEQQFGDLKAEGDIDQSETNTFIGDGLTNFEEYRGFRWGLALVRVGPDVVYQTPAYAPQGADGHFRGNPLRKDLFLTFTGYDAVNPFALGTALIDDDRGAGLDVHGAEATAVPGKRGLHVVPLVNDLTQTYPFTNGHINKRGVRDWTWDVKGASTVGDGINYGAPVTYQLTLDFYFADRPYTDDGSRNRMLDPLTAMSVEDRNDNGAIDVVHSVSEDVNRNGALDGDHVIVTSFGEALTSFDIDDDGFVELPVTSDPTVIDSRFEYSKAQVLKHTITHEIGHALGMTHNTDATCLMYEQSPNWSRDECLSLDSKRQIQIHND